MGDPGSPLCPVSAAWGLKELVLTVGMALLTSRPHVAMLMFIWGARRKVLPGDDEKRIKPARGRFGFKSGGFCGGLTLLLRENLLLPLQFWSSLNNGVEKRDLNQEK